ncbi:MAG: endolytic transglycosylase MltG [Saccharospirillum sp.]
MVKKILLFLFLLSFGVAAALVFQVKDELERPLGLDDETLYQVTAGASLRRVLTDFEARGWIGDARVHEVWLRFQEITGIQRGEYMLQPGETSEMVVRRMVAGDKVLRSVQLIEGWTFRQFRAAIAENEHITHSLSDLSDDAVLERLGLDLAHPEGWFFPDTYLFERGTTDAELLRQAHRKMLDELEQAWAVRRDNLPFDTAYEALIMASIIERETGVPYERPEIAGVFIRRLEQGMRLQTDPTVIYGLGDAYAGNITRTHLRTDTPYNTYTRHGLPPTPIANPGRGALRAAVNPAEGTSLFFVARGDGSHVFSDTYAEHNAAVQRYQRNRSADYRSAPTEDVLNRESTE